MNNNIDVVFFDLFYTLATPKYLEDCVCKFDENNRTEKTLERLFWLCLNQLDFMQY